MTRMHAQILDTPYIARFVCGAAHLGGAPPSAGMLGMLRRGSS